MSFNDTLNKSLAFKDLSEINTLVKFRKSILTEDDRGMASRIFQIVKRLLKLSISDLFKLADTGGNITESQIIINDLFTLTEAEVKDVSIKTVESGNYLKIVEVLIEMPGISFRGYLVVKLDISTKQIEATVRTRLGEWQPGQKPPFQWLRSVEDARNRLEVKEREIAPERPQKKPKLKSPKISNYKPPIDPMEIAAKLADQKNSPARYKIRQLDRQELQDAAEVGKVISKSDTWKVAKAIFLGYLSLTSLVTGVSGVAALLFSYLAIKGIEYGMKVHSDKEMNYNDLLKRTRKRL